ncbi:MAG: hypothetical protein PVH61_43990 [Candidatus Aminicenantes bacterium]
MKARKKDKINGIKRQKNTTRNGTRLWLKLMFNISRGALEKSWGLTPVNRKAS